MPAPYAIRTTHGAEVERVDLPIEDAMPRLRECVEARRAKLSLWRLSDNVKMATAGLSGATQATVADMLLPGEKRQK